MGIGTIARAVFAGASVGSLAGAGPIQDQEQVPRFTISTVAGTGERGMTLEDGPATAALMQPPTAVALDSRGNLYIADEGNRVVRLVTPDGRMTIAVGTGESDPQRKDQLAVLTNLSSAYGVAVDHDDNLYVLSRGHSKVFRVGEDGIARHIVGAGRGFGGDGGPAREALVNSPNHLVADAAGNLFIADTGNHRVRKVTPDGIISTVAGTGEPGFSGDGGQALDAQLAAPSAIAMDAHGNLYVADFSNHRVRKISADGVITSIAGTGVSGYDGDGRPALECQIGEPCGVAVDEAGYVYIGDQVNNRVRVVTPAGVMHTVAGTGVRGHSGDGGPAEAAQLSNPDIIAFDRNGDLYVPDHINAVVRKLTRVVAPPSEHPGE